MGKRKKPKTQWRMALYRAVGEFKNGERRMTSPDRFRDFIYSSRERAMKAKSHNYKEPWKPFIYQKGNPPKKVIEHQVFDENYSAE